MFRETYHKGMARFEELAPGLLLVTGITLFTRLVHGTLPSRAGALISEILIGLALGLIICNSSFVSARFESGICFSFKYMLRLAIILLGARISLVELARFRELALILLLITLAITVTLILGRLTGLPARLSVLIGLGTAICGNTAISVTAPVIHARDEEVSFAIASNTLFGTIAVFVLPVLGHSLGLTDVFFGTWAGMAVNDTSQVAAAGFGFSENAGDLATSIKLIRNALMGLVVVCVGLAFSKGHPDWQELSLTHKLRKSIPLFVIGFLVMATLNTLGFFGFLDQSLGMSVTGSLTETAKFLILFALIAVGLCTRFDHIRCMGFKPLLIGLAASLTTATTSFLALRLIFDL